MMVCDIVFSFIAEIFESANGCERKTLSIKSQAIYNISKDELSVSFDINDLSNHLSTEYAKIYET